MHKEYKEVKTPDEILKKIDAALESGKPITLGEAGLFDWLNKLSETDGWSVVWQAFNFPMIVLERNIGS
jgi:hypothetical protein